VNFRRTLACVLDPYYNDFGKDYGVEYEYGSYADQQGPDNNPQADSGQFGNEAWRQNELHIDAGWRRRHASKEQASGWTRGISVQKRQEAFAHWPTVALMVGLDTNVLVRYLIRDDQLQYEKARRLIDREVSKGIPVLVNLLVLLETEWVLRSRYGLAKAEIVTAFSAMLATVDLAFEDEPSVEHAIYSWTDSVADFADCLIEARNHRLGCRATATFDGKALELAGFISV
jgi:predicted nucleic-acid-binding protein